MKGILTILIIFLFVLAGKSQQQNNIDNSLLVAHKSFVSHLNVAYSFLLEDWVIDDQDSIDIDGFEACCIFFFNQIMPRQNGVKFQFETVISAFAQHINSLFIDLPPPAIS